MKAWGAMVNWWAVSRQSDINNVTIAGEGKSETDWLRLGWVDAARATVRTLRTLFFSDNIRTVRVRHSVVRWPHFIISTGDCLLHHTFKLSHIAGRAAQCLDDLSFRTSALCCWPAIWLNLNVRCRRESQFFHDCNFPYVPVPYAYVIFSITYVQYAYFILEGDVHVGYGRSLK